MKKAVFVGSLVSVLLLLVGTYAFGTDIVMWFASTSLWFTVLRVMMAAALMAVLVTTPPRSMALRACMGIASLICISAGLVIALSDSLHILDIIIFLQVGISLGIEALEYNEDELLQKAHELQRSYVDATALSTRELRQQFMLFLIAQSRLQAIPQKV